MATPKAAIEFLKSRWDNSEWADFKDFGPPAKRVVEAAAVRSMLLEALECSSGYFEPLRVRGVRVRGSLDLSNIALQAGNSFPALIFHDCVFTAEDIGRDGRAVSIDLSNVTVAEVSLVSCRFSYLRAQNCHITGSVNLSDCGPLKDWQNSLPARPGIAAEVSPAPSGDLNWPFDRDAQYEPAADWPDEIEDQCSVDLRQAHIGRSFIANGARLRAPRPRPQAERGVFSLAESRYALQLSEATIDGGIMLSNGFVAQGGIKIDAADVRGDVWLLGVTLVAGEGFALKAQASTFGGVFALREDEDMGSTALIFGCIYLQNSSALTLAIDNVWIQGDKSGAILAWNLEVTGFFTMRSLAANGQVTLSSASIGTEADFSRMTLHCREDGTSLLMTNATIKGSLEMAGVACRGQVNLENSEVGRNLDLTGARCGGTSKWALWLKGIAIGRDLRILQTFLDEREAPRPMTLIGGVMLDRCIIGGDLVWAGITFEEHDEELTAFSLDGADIRGALRPLHLTHKSPARINLRDARARTLADDPVQGWGDRSMRLVLDGFSYSLASGPDPNLRHDASRRGFLDRWIIGWYARAWDERIHSGNTAGIVEIAGRPRGTSPTLEEQAARFARSRFLRMDETAARIIRLLVAVLAAPAIMFSHLFMLYQAGFWRTRTLGAHLRLPAAVLAFPIALLLALFLTAVGAWRTFDIILFQHVSDAASVRLHWLRKQYPLSFGNFRSINAQTFSSQPFEQTARAMLAAGLDADARRILLYNQRYRRRAGAIWRKPDRMAFDFLAGHGLSPWRAMRTLFLAFLIGWFGVWRANAGGMLAVTVSPAATVVADTRGGLQPVLPHAPTQQSVSAIRCGDTIHEALYALDVFLPLVDLRQESECDVPSTPVSPQPGATTLAIGGGIIPRWAVNIDNRLEPVRLPLLSSGVLPLDKVDFWRVAKALYALAGWLLTSLAILTFSGVFRRN